ncbi:MAG: hypothetical protein ACLPXT_01515 [Terracidiphilus sp.]
MKDMTTTVFFSWQASRNARECRNLIEQALKMALEGLASDATLEEALRDGLELDKDTKNVPGSPPIFSTILAKIERAAIFVPDLTSVAKRNDGELIPNPNVLIEYGWALKTLSHSRIIPVMNIAYGNPKLERLPFDLAHLRFPITFNLPEGASEDDRHRARKGLANDLVDALKTIFESEEFKRQIPKSPKPPVFPRQKKVLDSMARFRPKGKPLGLQADSFARLIGQPETSEPRLGEGAACWFRLMPTIDPGRHLRVLDIKDRALELALMPILHMAQNIGFVRGSDGGGYYSVEGDNTTHSVAYVFKTGEIWLVDSWLAEIPHVELNEEAFTETLRRCAEFSTNHLQLPGPYQWEAGFEGIYGRMLLLPDKSDRAFGTAVEKRIHDNGRFALGEDPAETLRPFFEKVFDCFGVRRPSNTRV